MMAYWILIFLYFSIQQCISQQKFQTTGDSGRQWRNSQIKKQKRQSNVRTQAKRLERQRQLNERLREEVERSTQVIGPHLVFSNFSEGPRPVGKEEGMKKSRCTFIGADCSMEVLEQEAVMLFIEKNDVVLELGGRYGTTSCSIAYQQNNSGKLVVVEPDRDIWYILGGNQQSHYCSFYTLRGVVSETPALLSQAEYATRATSTESKSPLLKVMVNNSVSIPNMRFMDLQSELHMYFTVLLIDCEGCLDQLFSLAPDAPNYFGRLLQNVSTIILEADMKVNTPHCLTHCVDYQRWQRNFESVGFQLVHRKVDPVYEFIDHIVYQKRRLGV